MKLKPKMFMKILVRLKKYFDFSNYSSESKHYDDSTKSVVVKMKDKPGKVAIEKFVLFKQKMYSCLVDDTSEHKKKKVGKYKE